jgi:hypothetical protein
MKDNFSPLTENVLYCRRNGLLEDDVGRSLLGIYKAGVCDDTIARMFERRVSNHQFQQAFYGVIPFKTPKLIKGDYVLGLDQDLNKLRSFIQFLNAHSLTVAGSGAGKTTFSYFKILQIGSYVKAIWLFDLRKREFTILKPYLARLGIDLIVVPARSLRINPLQLPLGVDISDWLPRVADMFIEVLALPTRASKLLQAKLFPLYRKFQTKKNEFPTLYDLFEEFKKDKSTNPQARTAILDSLEPVLLSLGPKVLAYRYGWSSNELAKRALVFELAGCSETDKNMILNNLLLSEFTNRIARGISNPKMDLWICLDEAQRLCWGAGNTSAIGSQIGQVRGTGIGLDLSIQSTNGILPQIPSNTATKILGRCGSITDYTAAGHSMGLNTEQIHWAQINLEPGLFIGQLGEGDWRYPFVFRIPPMKLNKGTVNHQSDMNLLPDLPIVYASEFDHWGIEQDIISSEPSMPTNSLFDSEQEFRFCQAVVDHPMQPSSTYHKLAGIGPNTVKPIRQRLIHKGYLREHRIHTGRKGRSTLVLEPLPKGIDAVNEYLIRGII